KQLGHEVDFLDAYAVLASDAAAGADALVEDFVAGGKDAPDLVGVALVEEKNWVDVAVARVENVADAELVMLRDALDFTENVGELAARHDAVLRAVAGSKSAHGAEGLLAGLPQEQPFRVGGRAANFPGFVLLGQGFDAGGVRVEPGFQTVHLHDE